MRVLLTIEHDVDGVLDSSLRAATLARELSGSEGEVVGCLFARGPVAEPVAEPVAAALGEQGISRCFTVELPYAPVAWARSLAAIGAELGADAVVAAATDRGNEVMAHLGAITGYPMAANCFACEEGETAATGVMSLLVTRQRWAGSLVESANLAADRLLLTVATDAVQPVPSDLGRPAELVVFDPPLEEGDADIVAIESQEESGGVSLASARVVVSGGRGVGSPEGFAVLEELASLLGGAVGVSRAVTSLGWRPHSEQVGQTGTRVTPDLYMACGISGAIQHLAGCQSAKTMIAINTDGDAPIMTRADYAVIGDVGEVLPALVEAIKARS